jgi:septum formation protein
MLDVGGDSLRKPETRAEAVETLKRLSGREHQLIAAAVLVCDNQVLWRHVSTARLAMRVLDAASIDRYLSRAGDAVLSSVGAYQLEGLGAQLFERIEGDYFTILGLPLVALLDALRETGEKIEGLV